MRKVFFLLVLSLSTIGNVALAQDIKSTLLTKVQDTFFGIEMGTQVSSMNISNALRRRGAYREEKVDPDSRKVVFADVYFAGKRWTYANFYLTSKGLLYGIHFCDCINRDSDYTKEWRCASSIYELYRNALEDKYGEGVEKEILDGQQTTFLGSNDMTVIVSHKLGQSEGGEIRRYVELYYVYNPIGIQQNNLYFSEL